MHSGKDVTVGGADAPEPAPSGTLGGGWSEGEHRAFLTGLKKLGKVLTPLEHRAFAVTQAMLILQWSSHTCNKPCIWLRQCHTQSSCLVLYSRVHIRIQCHDLQRLNGSG